MGLPGSLGVHIRGVAPGDENGDTLNPLAFFNRDHAA